MPVYSDEARVILTIQAIWLDQQMLIQRAVKTYEVSWTTIIT